MVNWTAIGATLLPCGGGIFGAIFSNKEVYDREWYKSLKKPSWTPPNWVFGPVWTALYTSMGYASYRVFNELGGWNESSHIPLELYASQLLLNWAWSPIFFGAHSLKWGLADILAMDVAAAATGLTFYSADKTAGLLFVPYLMWLALATSLNAWIWKNNDTKKRD